MKLILRSLLPSIALTLFIAVAPAFANCPDSIASLEAVQPLMTRHWQQLQQQTTYPWGTARPYGTLSDRRVTLTEAFNSLSAVQKRQVINEVLSYPVPPENLQSVGMGTPPSEVYTSDGRAVSLPYDGCTRFMMLTERARYGYYYLMQNRDASNDPRILEQLRNVGRPDWRSNRFPISAASEHRVRLSFWNVVGYAQAESGWWIAWVSEQGYFEINVPEQYDSTRLQRFLQSAPRQYRYIRVVTDEIAAIDGPGLVRLPQ